MIRLQNIQLPLKQHDADPETHPIAILRTQVLELLKPYAVADADIADIQIFRRGYDARKRNEIVLVYTLDVVLKDAGKAENILLLAKNVGVANLNPTPDMAYQPVAAASQHKINTRPIVIGLGPCGLFIALILAQAGLCPIVLERGKAVRERTKDTWDLWRKNNLHPESNVQFGEGGAGTFSDGKLWSQIKDPRHLGRKVIDEFIAAGAPPEIAYVSKPHVGTFRLVGVVETMRAQIVALGGEVRFGARVAEILIENVDSQRKAVGVRLDSGEVIESRHVALAVGHSARDTFGMLVTQGVAVEAKPFSVGYRIEHPQGMIDRARFGPFAGNAVLGAADYKLVYRANNGRSVYSFCMCPGGTVVAATSEIGRVVTNGMSQYSRNERNANAAIVVGVTPDDFAAFRGAKAGELSAIDTVLAGVDFQRSLESKAFELGGENYCAPAQLVGDFLAGRASTGLGNVLPSYQPGVKLGDLGLALPDYAVAAIREALPAFDREIRGFAMADAVLTGVETRTSSPVRFVRHKENHAFAPLQSTNTLGLFPAGEGAGYAGGIFSAAIDGIEVAEAMIRAVASNR